MDFYPEFKALLKKQDFREPTSIQAASSKVLRDGESVIGLAKTGTGKTLAFSLPILLQAKVGEANSVVIFEPTTELAIQTRDAILPFAKQLGLRPMALVGAGNRARQIDTLKKKHPEVIVATPGRFFDMLTEKRIQVPQIKHLVIDEADDILEATKMDLLASLGQNMSPESQIVLFGATESEVTQNAEKLFDREFIKVDVRDQDESKVQHLFLQVDNRHKVDVITRLVKADKFSGILFFNSVKQLEYFAGILSHTKINFDVLTNAASKQSRQLALKALEKHKIKLLLATDLAARGLDIPKLLYVINFDLPEDENTYTHRAGRTGRVGRKGYVVSLGTDHDFRDLKKTLIDLEAIKIERAYFKGFELTTTKPEKKAKVEASGEQEISDSNKEEKTNKTKAGYKKQDSKFNKKLKNVDTSEFNSVENVVKPQKRKKKKKNNKNKGYHPHGAKKKGEQN